MSYYSQAEDDYDYTLSPTTESKDLCFRPRDFMEVDQASYVKDEFPEPADMSRIASAESYASLGYVPSLTTNQSSPSLLNSPLAYDPGQMQGSAYNWSSFDPTPGSSTLQNDSLTYVPPYPCDVPSYENYGDQQIITGSDDLYAGTGQQFENPTHAPNGNLVNDQNWLYSHYKFEADGGEKGPHWSLMPEYKDNKLLPQELPHVSLSNGNDG